MVLSCYAVIPNDLVRSEVINGLRIRGIYPDVWGSRVSIECEQASIEETKAILLALADPDKFQECGYSLILKRASV